MKRFYSFMAAALTLITAASCVQELQNDAQHPEDAVVYKAIADGADTKAVLGTNGSGRPQSMWEDGDKINIYVGGGQAYIFTASLDEPSPVAEFKYKGVGEIDFSDVSAVIAAYPSSISRWADPKYSMMESEISTFQKAPSDVDSYDRNAVPAMAYSTDRTLHFQNAASLLKFNVNQDGVSKVRFTSRNGEFLTGKVTIVLNNDKEVGYINPDEHGFPETLMDFAELSSDGTFQPSRTYYISIIPGTLETGFILEFLDAEGIAVYTKEYNRSITIKRNVILDLGTLGKSASVESGDYIDEYGINHGPGVEIDGVVWAPVNCGYHEADFKYGKLYQWGRKYGQGYDGDIYDGDWDQTYSDGVVPEIVQGPVSLSLGQSKDNENKFYCNISYPYNWCNTPEGNLWNMGTEDNPVKTEYDPCPTGWRVPTYTELFMLKQNGTWALEDGQNGHWFCGPNLYTATTSRVFFSAAGRRLYDGTADIRGDFGNYWSSRPSGDDARFLYFNSHIVNVTDEIRGIASSVRCVQDDSELVLVEELILDKTEITLAKGESYTLSATISPANANHQCALWSSEDTSVAVVDKNGQVNALKVGTTTITAVAGMKAVQCEVTVVSKDVTLIDYVDEYDVNHGKGVNIDGVVWAPVNCGYHETDFKYGKLYQWGRKYGQGYSGRLCDLEGNTTDQVSDAILPTFEEGPVSAFIANQDSNANVFYKGKEQYNWNYLESQEDDLWNAGTESDPIKSEYDPCPDGWRVPTYAELNALSQNYSEMFVNDEGKIGSWYSGSNHYTTEASRIFLLAAGGRGNSGECFSGRGGSGRYRSSKLSGSEASFLIFSIGGVSFMSQGDSPANGYSVRCVQQ